MPRRTNRKRAGRLAKRKPAKQPSPTKPIRQIAQLEACEEMYLRALSDPFDPLIRGKVCYPAFPAKQSVKYVGSALANVSIGTGGVGWLIFDPTASGTHACIFYTDATYAGNTSSTLTTTTGSGVSSATFTTPTATSAFNESVNGNQFRLIAAGAQFRYTGTELNRGGSVYTINSPQQVSLNGYLIGNAAVPSIAREHRVIDTYQTVVVPPSHEEDVEWKDSDQLFPWSDGGGSTPAPISGIIFFGTPGNTFVVRLIVHYEVSGPSYNSYGTLSHIGRQQVVQSISAAAGSAAYGPPSRTNYVEQFANTLKRVTHNPVVQNAGNMVLQLGLGYLSRRMGVPQPTNVGMIAGSSGRMAIDVD